MQAANATTPVSDISKAAVSHFVQSAKAGDGTLVVDSLLVSLLFDTQDVGQTKPLPSNDLTCQTVIYSY